MGQFDFLFLGICIIGAVVGLYIMNWMGIATHGSGLKLGAGVTKKGGRTGAVARGTYPTPTPVAAIGKSVINNVGPNEPSNSLMSRPMSGGFRI